MMGGYSVCKLERGASIIIRNNKRCVMMKKNASKIKNKNKDKNDV
jgi:hypothetical protein